jgi:hypothetical protein
MEELLELKINKLESEANLIMVKYPYNKLFGIKYDGEILEAKVINEYLTEGEEGPIGVAEAGRHLAICGSICLAKEYNFNDSAYFLAIHAKLTRIDSKIENSDFFSLKTKAIFKGKRNAKIHGEIFSDSNELIFSVEIEYQIIQQNIFQKLFNKNLNTTIIQNNVSPYIKRKNLTNLIVSNKNAQGDYGKVLPHECEGHFENYPALPVAIVGNLFIDLGIKLFNKHTNNTFSKALIIDTEIKALRLAFSGEEVRFSTNLKSIISEDEVIITGEAKVEDEIVSTIEFKIKGCNY